MPKEPDLEVTISRDLIRSYFDGDDLPSALENALDEAQGQLSDPSTNGEVFLLLIKVVK